MNENELTLVGNVNDNKPESLILSAQRENFLRDQKKLMIKYETFKIDLALVPISLKKKEVKK